MMTILTLRELLASCTLLVLILVVQAADRPNVVWLISEDNSSYLGCYGDKNAVSPNLDALAAKGMRYTNCFANAPVCAPARCTLLLGTHASTVGTFHMRSMYKVSPEIVPFHTPLKEAGYMVMGSKGDYNNSSYNQKELWDGHAGKHPYLKRADKSQPFFTVYNVAQSHESRIFHTHPVHKKVVDNPRQELKHSLEIPPYQVDNEATRQDWQKVYASINEMDATIGNYLKVLDKSGEADNTIVFYVSDHGGTMIRSKRYLYDSGTRVPFIAYFPEKWQHLAPDGYAAGAVSERLVDFTDIIKTLLAVCDVKIPEHYAGQSFAGESPESPQDYALLFSGRFDETPDLSRGLTDGRYKYIRNYEPDRKLHQLLSYPFGQQAQVEHFKAFQAGETNELQSKVFQDQEPELFFDTQSDPHEVTNLIDSQEHRELIQTFRTALDEKLVETHDLAFIPEPAIEKVDKGGSSIYDWARREGNYPLPELISLANLASAQDPENIPAFVAGLTHGNPIMRYWASLGLRVLKERAEPAQAALIKATEDPDYCVRISAHMALGNIGDPDTHSRALLVEASQAKHDIASAWGLGGAKYLEFSGIEDYYSDKQFSIGPYARKCYQDLKSGKTYTKLKK